MAGASPSGADPAAAKAELRRTVLAGRRAAGPARRAAADVSRTAALLAALGDAPELRRTQYLTCYLSVGTEPDTRALLPALAAAGLRVLLPRLRAGGGLEWVADDGTRAVGRRGLAAPTGPALDPARAAVWLVPALAVDQRGVRLGRGGGAYDRCLPADRPVIALLHAGELRDRLPAEPHDRPVTAVALPTGVLRL